jgi:hypothetical protein
MMNDPFLLKQLGAERLDQLREDAATQRAARPDVPRWRRRAGESLVRAGMRLLDQQPPAELRERPAR